MTNEIKKIDNDTLYHATVHFYSKGDGDNVTTLFEVSHGLAEDFDGPMPAAYGVAQEILMSIRERSTLYAASADDVDYMQDPNVSPEDKVSRVLDSAQAQEEALNAVLN